VFAGTTVRWDRAELDDGSLGLRRAYVAGKVSGRFSARLGLDSGPDKLGPFILVSDVTPISLSPLATINPQPSRLQI
jgi:hypothetical protein